MRIVGWPTVWKEEEGLFPVEVQDIDIHLNTEELTQLATFLIAASKNASPSNPQELSIDFADSKENPKTGITVTVHVPGQF